MHYRSLGVPVAAGVGATIDFLSGHVKRAPVWMQRIGTEWVFRLAQEPSRLLGRYAKDLWVFGQRILAQWWQLQWGANRRIAAEKDLHLTEKNPITASPSEKAFQWFHLPDRLDFMAVSQGALRIEKILGDGRNCLLQMDNIEFIDSTGIGMLIHLQKKLRASGQLLILIAPSVAIKSSLKLMQLQDFFATATDIKEAAHLLKARELEVQTMIDPGDTRRSNVLRWQGEITAVNAEQVWTISRIFLESASEASQPEITIDLSAVRFIDSSGLGVMVRTRKLAQRHGTKLVFSAAQPAVQNVLRLSRLEEFLLGTSHQKIAARRG
jgi:N-acetylglucosaminyldiphosphoundecaprenol N-acetyl-beta-D-mannosaminyltransferase